MTPERRKPEQADMCIIGWVRPGRTWYSRVHVLLRGGRAGRKGKRGRKGPQQHSSSQRIPRCLWVCRLKRQRGFAMHQAMAARVLAATSGPSMGCREKRLKARLAKRSG